MAKSVPRTEVVEYVAKLLKANPDIAYSDAVKEGKKAGYHVYPLIMGLAKNTLGMGRKKTKKGPGRPRGPGRPAGAARRGRPPAASALGRGFTADLVRGIERMQGDVAAMRAALREIARLSAKF